MRPRARDNDTITSPRRAGMGPTIPAAPLVLGRLQCRLARRRGRCGREGYQVFVGDLAGAGSLEWPLRLLLVIGGIQLFALAIIGDYVARVLEEVKHRPHFVVRSVLNSPGETTREEVGPSGGARSEESGHG